MTRWLAAARQADLAGTQPTKPTKTQPQEVASVKSVLSGASSRPSTPPGVARTPETIEAVWDAAMDLARRSAFARPPCDTAPRPLGGTPDADLETFPHGDSVAGSPRTWTGRVVSLDAWRALSEWERHGSTGKLWNGRTRRWEDTP